MSAEVLIDGNLAQQTATISVIIPCYNQAHYLARALTSLIEQDYAGLQVIVVDDGSASPVVLPQNEWPFNVILHRQENQGLAAARNTGIQLADGQMIKFLDADDVLLPGCLKAQVDSMANNSNSVSVIGFVDHSLHNNEIRQIIPAFSDPLEAFLLQNIAPVHSYLFSKHSLISVGGFCTDERTQGGCEDYDLLLRLVIAGVEFISVHKLGVVYYRYAQSMSTQRENMHRTRAAVWSYNVRYLLAANYQLSASQASALLCGWWQLLNSTPSEHQFPLSQCTFFILAAIKSAALQPEYAERPLLCQKLSKHPETLIVAQAIANESSGETAPLHVPVQSIIDRRLVLLNFDKNFNEEWLCQVLATAKATNGRFAIYGAGDMGRRLARILVAAGFVPMCFIDKTAKPGGMLDGINIITPDALSALDISLIVIASARFYREIKANLMLSNQNVEIL